MNSSSLRIKFIFVVLSFLLCPLATALDAARFKDANGDLVADAPTDPKNFVDPATLIFAYTPLADVFRIHQGNDNHDAFAFNLAGNPTVTIGSLSANCRTSRV